MSLDAATGETTLLIAFGVKAKEEIMYPTPTGPILVSVKESARLLSLGLTKTNALISEGTLQSVTVGTRRLVKLESVKALADIGAQS